MGYDEILSAIKTNKDEALRAIAGAVFDSDCIIDMFKVLYQEATTLQESILAEEASTYFFDSVSPEKFHDMFGGVISDCGLVKLDRIYALDSIKMPIIKTAYQQFLYELTVDAFCKEFGLRYDYGYSEDAIENL